MDILSKEILENEKNGITAYNVFIAGETDYTSYHVPKTGKIIKRDSYPKINYKNYEHFAGVMGKFNPYTAFFPAKSLKELNFDAISVIK